ncbi:MAG: tandem-95 repeat protein [Planctomycetaceae bacterium]|nr:tandem-95 repeat protein [Planctomycetaceae bacterium]
MDPAFGPKFEQLEDRLLLSISPIPVGTFLEVGGQAVMETENFTTKAAGAGAGANTAWTATTGATGYSGASAMAATPNAKVSMGDSLDGARLDYQVNFETAGTYYVWVRTIGATGSDDSINVGLDGQAATLGKWGMSMTTSAWGWNDCVVDGNGATRVTIDVKEAGLHTFNIWMREDGTVIDKVILTQDAAFKPTGVGPVESSRAATSQSPVAVNDAVSTEAGKPATVNVLANDSDPDGDALSVVSFTQGAKGSVSAGTNGTLIYTPAAGFVGDDAFNYTISDGKGATASGSVAVTVTAAPTAGDGAFLVSGGLVSMEAENFSAKVAGTGAGANTVWTATTALSGFSGANAMQALPNAKVSLGDSLTGARMDYQVQFDAPGTYYVWIRTIGATGSDDSVNVGLDGQAATLGKWGMTMTTSTWAWNNGVKDAGGTTRVAINVTTAGVHTFNVWMREDGTAVDKIILTRDASFTPTGTGPAQSARAGGPAANADPTAANDAASTAEDTPVTIAPLTNDRDADGDTLTISANTQPANGTLVKNANGTFTYTPKLNYNGTDSFNYTVSDGKGGTAKALVNITITPVNDAPAAVDDAATTAEDTPVTVNPLANDTDVDGDALTISANTQPANGTLVKNANGTFTYTPKLNYNGADSFNYTVSDGKGGTATATVAITVTAVNDAPAAVNDTATTPQGQPVTIDVLANDSDVDADTLSVASFTQGAHGSVIAGSDGLVYTPAAAYSGQDSFTYVASDGKGGQATGTVTLTVTPVSTTGAFIESGGQVSIEAENFTGKVSGTGDGANTAWTATTALTGFSGAGAMQALPNAKVSLGDSLVGARMDYAIEFKTPGTYYVWVRTLGATGSDDSIHVGLDGQAVTTGSWGMSDTTATWDWNNSKVDASGATRVTVNVATAGVHTLNVWMREDGTAVDKIVLSRDATFTPTATGPVQSPRTGTTTNASPLGYNDAATTTAGKAVVIDVLANDIDPDGDTLSISQYTQPASGTLVKNSNGTFTYTPAAGFAGTTSFGYTVTDGKGGYGTANVDILVVADTGGGTGTGVPGEELGSVYYIDRDGDGYGVASSKGPDADDTDASVYTWQQGVAKYGTFNAFLSHLGYDPTRIIYVSKTGSNTTGVIGDMNKPFASFSAVSLKPGDMVIYRGGTYGSFNDNSVDGTASNPIVFMAMPGEKVVFSSTGDAMGVDGSYVIFDGFVASNPNKNGAGSGIENHYGHNMTFRNMEAVGFKWGFHAVQDLQNILVEYSVFHDNPGEHGLYFGSRDLPSANITIRDSLFYRNGRTGIQFNGRVTNLLIEDNVIHTNNLGGVSFLEGVHDSTVRHNLIFNNNKQGIVVNTYDDAMSTILPYNQYNLTIEDNIIWVGRYSWNGNYQPANFQGILFNDTTAAQKYQIYGCVIRNNTIVTYAGPAIEFNNSRTTNNEVYGNTFYRMSGGSGTGAFAINGTNYSFSSFEAYSSKYHGNTYADPGFADASVNYYLTPDKFDFRQL